MYEDLSFGTRSTRLAQLTCHSPQLHHSFIQNLSYLPARNNRFLEAIVNACEIDGCVRGIGWRPPGSLTNFLPGWWRLMPSVFKTRLTFACSILGILIDTSCGFPQSRAFHYAGRSASYLGPCYVESELWHPMQPRMKL